MTMGVAAAAAAACSDGGGGGVDPGSVGVCSVNHSPARGRRSVKAERLFFPFFFHCGGEEKRASVVKSFLEPG